jgi:hypothetical protein
VLRTWLERLLVAVLQAVAVTAQAGGAAASSVPERPDVAERQGPAPAAPPEGPRPPLCPRARF